MSRTSYRSEAVSSVGRALKEARLKRGWSQDELAHASKVSQSSIARVERGSTAPMLDVVLHICSALGMDPGMLPGFHPAAKDNAGLTPGAPVAILGVDGHLTREDGSKAAPKGKVWVTVASKWGSLQPGDSVAFDTRQTQPPIGASVLVSKPDGSLLLGKLVELGSAKGLDQPNGDIIVMRDGIHSIVGTGILMVRPL